MELALAMAMGPASLGWQRPTRSRNRGRATGTGEAVNCDMGDGEEATGATPAYGYRPRLLFQEDVEKYFCSAFGAQHFNHIRDALVCPSRYTCIRVNTLQTSRKDVIDKLSCILGKDYTGCRDQPTRHSANNVKDLFIEHPLLPSAILVRGDGPHNICYSGATKEVVVSRKCAEAVLRGANVFVPGVLACSSHVEQGDIVAVSVAMEHLDANHNWVVGVTRGTVLLSEHGMAQMNDVDRRNCYIGKGKAMLSRTSIFRDLQGVAVEMIDRVYRLPPLHGVLKGEIFLQNLPSIVTATVLDPQPGECILDMCAAPGGKTTAIAILMEDKGTIIATDRSHNKVMDIVKLAEEMKLASIKALKLDALKAVEKGLFNASTEKSTSSDEISKLGVDADVWENSVLDPINLEQRCSKQQQNNGSKVQQHEMIKARNEARRLRNGAGKVRESSHGQMKGFPPHSFDRVLLDPPCSALGLRPRLFAGEETIENLRRHSVYQKRLLDQAVQLCRPGGVIVYSTCTINPGENEAVVRYALDTYSFLSLMDQNPKLGGPGLTGGLDDGVSYKEWLREEEKDFVQRFDPSGPLDTIGFFIAKFQVAGAKVT